MSRARTQEEKRTATINLRASRRQRTLIDHAAETLGKNRSDFMLEAACREAGMVLMDRKYFIVDEKTYQRFNEELDKPVGTNARLQRLMTSRAPWDK